MILAMDLILVILIGFPWYYQCLWIYVYLDPLNLIIADAGFALFHPFFQFKMRNRKGCCRWCTSILALMVVLGLAIAGVCVIPTAESYTSKLKGEWTDNGIYYNLRNSAIEAKMECCGWENRTSPTTLTCLSEARGVGRPLCSKLVTEQVKVFVFWYEPSAWALLVIALATTLGVMGLIFKTLLC
jgi:hypothetical protein